MKHPLIINSNGKAQKEDSWLKSLSSLGQIIDKRTLTLRKFFLNQSDYQDILKIL